MFEQLLLFTDLHTHRLSHASSYHFNTTVWKCFVKLTSKQTSWRTNAHLPPFNSGISSQMWICLYDCHIFFSRVCTRWSSWLNMLSWTSCAFTLFICTFISIRINHKSVFNKKKWLTLRTTVFETSQWAFGTSAGFRFLTLAKLHLGTGFILDLRMWKYYTILVKLTN